MEYFETVPVYFKCSNLKRFLCKIYIPCVHFILCVYSYHPVQPLTAEHKISKAATAQTRVTKQDIIKPLGGSGKVPPCTGHMAHRGSRGIALL
jgi:hypothetical protein